MAQMHEKQDETTTTDTRSANPSGDSTPSNSCVIWSKEEKD